MFRCSCCDEQLISNQDLLLHAKVAHPTLAIYRCSEYTCQRSFSSYYSFWKHRKREHAVSKLERASDKSSNINVNLERSDDVSMREAFCADDTYYTDDNIRFPACCEKVDCNLNTSDNFENDDLSHVHGKDEKFKFDFEKSLNSTISLIIAKWFSILDLPRKRVQMFINDFTVFLNDQAIHILRDKILSRLELLGENSLVIAEIQSMFISFQNPFKNLNTEYKQLKYFEKQGTLILPATHTIGFFSDYRHVCGKQIIKQIPISAQYIPISKVLVQFFNLENIYKDTVEYVNHLYNNRTVICNIIQGNLWREKMKTFGQKFTLPLILFFDEYETNNPLGSHKGIQKCGSLYLKISCLPPKFQSKLSNIFLFALFSAFETNNPDVFQPAVHELNNLESNGITIFIDNEPKQIFFKLITIVGDNLGLHQIFGLSQSFNATYFCRFCKTKRNEINTKFYEDQCELRTKENHKKDLIENDVSSTGVAGPSKFNDLNDFHFTENLAVDLMHDLLEGVCQYDLGLVLHYFITKKNSLFSLSEFNLLVQGFHYNVNDKKNKPTEFLETHLKSKCYSMSASEMLILIKNLPMIVGHLVPVGDRHWHLIILLNQIILLVSEKYCQYGCWDILDCLISDYLIHLRELFPNSFKPKHHFLLHYARVMERMGPLWHIACMNFERKHHSSKTTAHVPISRRNIFYTLALKEQLTLNYIFLRKHQNNPEFTTGPTRAQIIEDLHYFNDLPLSQKTVSTVEWISYNGEIWKPGMVVMIASEHGPKFYLINYLIFDVSIELKAITTEIICSLNEHFQSYKIDRINTEFKCLNWDEIKNGRISSKTVLGDNFEYIFKRWS